MSKFLLLPLVVMLAWLWNLAVVDVRYATRAEWEAQDGGWLPSILPGSVRDIHTVNNLDLDTSQGEFEFSDTDAGDFFARLSLDVPAKAPFADWQGILEDYRGSGHVAWSYREGAATWVFFCDPTEDSCDYLRWTSSDRGRSRLASAQQRHAGHRPE